MLINSVLFSRKALVTVVLAIGGFANAPRIFANDSDSDAAASFLPVVKASQGVMIRVPLRNGDEDTTASELRVVADHAVSAQPEDFVATWARAANVANVPVVDANADSDTSDSSTCGYGWGSWRGSGYYSSYYANYRPSYYYGYDRYSYGNPSRYYDYRSNYGYYYYSRYW